MADFGSLRRVTVFALLFGGAMGFVAWKAGGMRPGTSRRQGGDAVPESPAVVNETARVTPSVSVGASDDGTLTQDAVKVIGGKPRRFRAWTATWRKSAPRKSADPEVGVQELEAPRLVLYPEPTTAEAPPVADGGPGTTRIAARTGVLEYQKGVRTEVRLKGAVELDHLDPESGDFRLRTESLDCTIESHGESEVRHAQTADRVVIDGGGTHLEGTGLDSELAGLACRVTLLHDVKGHFDAAVKPGAGSPDAKRKPTDVTCSGAFELLCLDPKTRGGARRWRATFHDEVHVVQGPSTLDCDLLEIEFRMGEGATKAPAVPDRMVATGHVRSRGRTELRDYEIVCERSTATRTGNVGNEIELVVFEGSPVMNVHGPLSVLGKSSAPAGVQDPAAKGRIQIRCDGLAKMSTRRASATATSVKRTSVVFEKNVVVEQWDDEKLATPTGELHAPTVTLFGTTLDERSFQPDTLIAEGGVDLKRVDFTSHSSAATWAAIGDMGVQRYVLTGKPVVEYSGIELLRVSGVPKKARNARLQLQAEDNVKIDLYDERPPDPKAPPRPYALLSAGPRVVLVQIDDGEEISRLTADGLDATVAQGRQLENVKAYGGAHMWGLGPDGQQRDLYGSRIVLDRLVLPAGAPKDAPHPAQGAAFGEEGSPAVAIVREKDGSRHDVRADMLRYDQNGEVITGAGHLVATLDVIGREAKPEAKAPKVVEGAVKITAADARVELAPGRQGAAGARSLRRVAATGGVLIDGKLNRVSGREATYDAATGMAVVKGAPARVVNTAESERYTSSLNADEIQAFFDTSDDTAAKGRLLRAVCPKGGVIVRYFDPPDAQGRPVPGSTPRRLVISSAGPIEATQKEATAVTDVRAGVYSLTSSGDWTQEDVIVYCERAHITFDPDGPGGVKDRLRTFTASGGAGRQISVTTPEIRASADRADFDFTRNKMHLSTTGGNPVYVRDLKSGRQILFDSGTYDYQTKEWTDYERMREVEETPIQTTPVPNPEKK